MSTTKPTIINLPKISDPRGNLTFIEAQNHIPFQIKRTYWIYDVPGGETRGGHAFKEQEEFIVALSGSFDVIVDTGIQKKTFHLNRSYEGLHIPAGNWRSMTNFSTNSLAVVLASTYFDDTDYIHDYDEFITIIGNIPNVTTISANVENKLKKQDVLASISTINDCKLFELDKNHKEKGNITVIENGKQIPFNIERVYYLYDVPGGEERGGHAHRELSQLIVAASGSFDVVLKDGTNTEIITLNRPYQGLYIVPGIWRELVNFSSGSICLVLASEHYKESDYLREYEEFLNIKK